MQTSCGEDSLLFLLVQVVDGRQTHSHQVGQHSGVWTRAGWPVHAAHTEGPKQRVQNRVIYLFIGGLIIAQSTAQGHLRAIHYIQSDRS